MRLCFSSLKSSAHSTPATCRKALSVLMIAPRTNRSASRLSGSGYASVIALTLMQPPGVCSAATYAAVAQPGRVVVGSRDRAYSDHFLVCAELFPAMPDRRDPTGHHELRGLR